MGKGQMSLDRGSIAGRQGTSSDRQRSSSRSCVSARSSEQRMALVGWPLLPPTRRWNILSDRSLTRLGSSALSFSGKLVSSRARVPLPAIAAESASATAAQPWGP